MNLSNTTFASDSPLSRFDGRDGLFLKEELRLTTNSYKIRGVTAFFQAVGTLPPSIEVLSAGNLALATAHECQKRGVACTAIVPAGISEIKKKNLLRLGAKLIERPFEEIWNLVFRNDLRDRDDFLHPLNAKLIDGYGHISREIHTQLSDCGGLVIPYGLGGLALGIVRALKSLGSSIPVFICEIENYAPLSRALSSGKSVSGPKLYSFIEAMGTPEVIPDVFAEIADSLEGILTVTENEVCAAIRMLYAKQNIRAEGAAGAAFAAVQKLANQGKQNLVAVLTGGNISDDVFSEIIHGVIRE